MALYSPEQLGIKAPSGGFQQGGWYDGRQYWDGKLGDVNVIINPNQQGYSQQVSKEVVQQTNPNNWDYLQGSIQASNITSPVNLGLSSSNQSTSGLQAEVDTYRKQLDEMLAKQKAEADAKLVETRQKEQEALGEVKKLTTPFREDLEKTERERLYINQNFEENQKLVNELEQLLTEGNELIKQQQSVTGLAAVRNPRIQQTMNDVQARAGVIEAVINARNGQIAQAQNMIDRSVNAITADRMDQLSYYNTVLSLANRDIIMLDAESKDIAKQQIDLIKNDLDRANATVDYVKQLLLNPDTAGLMGSAGVKLTDSVEQINAKLQTATYTQELRDYSNQISLQGGTPVLDPSGVPANQLVSFTDSRGKTHYYKMPATGSGGFDMGSFMSSLSDYGVSPEASSELTSIIDQVVSETGGASGISSNSTNPNQSSQTMSVQPPIFTPLGGPGTHYKDPATGVTWVYQSSGWVRA